MRTSLPVGAIAVAAALLLSTNSALAEGAVTGGSTAATTAAAPATAPGEALAATVRERMEAEIAQVAATRRSAGKVASALQAFPAAVTAGELAAMVDIEILTTSDAAVRDAVVALGGTVTGGVPGRIVQAKVPAAAVAELAARRDVMAVRPPVTVSIEPADPTAPATPAEAGAASASAGSVNGEELAKLNAASWHAANITGAGLKIGIIDSFGGAEWNAAQAAGDVVAPAGTTCINFGIICALFDAGSQHGVAVAEIIHEVAPSATLYLAKASSASDLLAVVQWFESNGVKIISRSLAAPLDGPGDGTGALDDVARYAAQHGITWFNSAGNSADGGYYRGLASNPDGDQFLNLVPGPIAAGLDDSEIMVVQASPSCGAMLGLRWSDWGPPPTRSDYDLLRFDVNGNLIASYEADQQSGAPPIEAAGYQQCSPIELIVAPIFSPGSGIGGDIVEVMANGLLVEVSQAPFSATQPVSDSATIGVVSVGAIDPAAGASVPNYSSQGPSNDGRVKPDVSAASCVHTFTYGPATCFQGTSASAPAAAGAAALVLQSGWAATPAELHSYLATTATDRGVGGSDNASGHGEVILPNFSVPPPTNQPSRFVAVPPARILDTRIGQGAPQRPVPDTGIITVQVTGQAGVPGGASAVVLNVTETGNTGPGHVQVLPTGRGTLTASSNLNLEHPQTIANTVIVPVGVGGKVTLYVRGGGGTANLVGDVFGYFVPAANTKAGRYKALGGSRVLDTRSGLGSPTAGQPRPGNSLTEIDAVAAVTALDPSAATDGVSAVVMNVTATEAGGYGYVQVIPTNGPTPISASSNVNYIPGQTIPNLVIVPVGANGHVSLFNAVTPTHLLADVVGYFTGSSAAATANGLFVPLTPARLYDTRFEAGPIPPAGAKHFSPLGVASVPASGVAAVVLNETAVGATAPGWVQVLPTDGAPYGSYSNLNVERAGQTIPNAVITKLGTAGRFTAFTISGTNLVSDLSGYLTG
jgi:Subtilase family